MCYEINRPQQSLTSRCKQYHQTSSRLYSSPEHHGSWISGRPGKHWPGYNQESTHAWLSEYTALSQIGEEGDRGAVGVGVSKTRGPTACLVPGIHKDWDHIRVLSTPETCSLAWIPTHWRHHIGDKACCETCSLAWIPTHWRHHIGDEACCACQRSI